MKVTISASKDTKSLIFDYLKTVIKHPALNLDSVKSPASGSMRGKSGTKKLGATLVLTDKGATLRVQLGGRGKPSLDLEQVNAWQKKLKTVGLLKIRMSAGTSFSVLEFTFDSKILDSVK